jgi:hypothetical protein
MLHLGVVVKLLLLVWTVGKDLCFRARRGGRVLRGVGGGAIGLERKHAVEMVGLVLFGSA